MLPSYFCFGLIYYYQLFYLSRFIFNPQYSHSTQFTHHTSASTSSIGDSRPFQHQYSTLSLVFTIFIMNQPKIPQKIEVTRSLKNDAQLSNQLFSSETPDILNRSNYLGCIISRKSTLTSILVGKMEAAVPQIKQPSILRFGEVDRKIQINYNKIIFGQSKEQVGQMGILKLMDFIKKSFPKSLKFTQPQYYANKILALDASNWIYQFLIKTQNVKNGNISTPTDWMGNHTGHLIGMLSRVNFCLQNNINTIWVFDGQPPDEKYSELKRRKQLKQKAQQNMQEAIQQGEVFDLLKQSQRSVRITKAEKADAIKMIRLIGLPVVQSPSQAQAQCTELVKSNIAYGVISEDMDTLAFGCPRLIRNFKAGEECIEVDLQTLLKQTQLTYDQFIDFCILCGCDYTTRIKNIGPTRAYKYLKQYKSIDRLLEQIATNDKLRSRHEYDDEFNHLAARKIFKKPEVKKLTTGEVQRTKFQEEELVKFLEQKQFSPNRIGNWLNKVKQTKFYKQSPP